MTIARGQAGKIAHMGKDLLCHYWERVVVVVVVLGLRLGHLLKLDAGRVENRCGAHELTFFLSGRVLAISENKSERVSETFW